MRKFENPEMDVVKFTAEDVIATSGGTCDTHCTNYGGDDNL